MLLDVLCLFQRAMTSSAPQGDRAPESCLISQIKTAHCLEVPQHCIVPGVCQISFSIQWNPLTFNPELVNKENPDRALPYVKISLCCATFQLKWFVPEGSTRKWRLSASSWKGLLLWPAWCATQLH